MRKLILFAAFAIGCATVKPAPTPNIYDGAPAWVTQGAGAFSGDRNKAFYGVGSVSMVANPSLRRDAAEAKARAAIAKEMNTYTANLDKQYAESTAAGDGKTVAPQEVQMITDALKTFTAQQINGAEILNHWIASDGTEFALARLDFDAFKDSMTKVNELNDRMRAVIKARADSAFDELNKEEAKHAAAPQ